MLSLFDLSCGRELGEAWKSFPSLGRKRWTKPLSENIPTGRPATSSAAALPLLCDSGQGSWSCFHLCKVNTAQPPCPVLRRA